MPVHLQENQYRGVNAHLQSHFSRSGDWPGFYREHVKVTVEHLNVLLPEQYTVEETPSLQRAYYDLFADDAGIGLARFDADAYAKRDYVSVVGGHLSPDEPTFVMPVTNLLIEQSDIPSVGIYKDGKLITRVELISMASKPTGSHHYQYRVKRSQALTEQIKLVELDYFHERRSLIFELPDYSRLQAKSYPYNILVTELISKAGEGHTDVYAFRVEDPIPTVNIPLDGSNVLPFDFGMVYHKAFASNTLNGLRIVDYSVEPDGIDQYSPDDQERIRTRMDLVMSLRGE